MRLDLPGLRLERSSEGHVFLFEERYGFIYLLNASAAALVDALVAEDQTADSLARLLEDRFQAQDAGIDNDVKGFLQKLRMYGLLD